MSDTEGTRTGENAEGLARLMFGHLGADASPPWGSLNQRRKGQYMDAAHAVLARLRSDGVRDDLIRALADADDIDCPTQADIALRVLTGTLSGSRSESTQCAACLGYGTPHITDCPSSPGRHT